MGVPLQASNSQPFKTASKSPTNSKYQSWNFRLKQAPILSLALALHFVILGTSCQRPSKKAEQIKDLVSVSNGVLISEKAKQVFSTEVVPLGKASDLIGFTPNSEEVFYIQRFHRGGGQRTEIFSLDISTGSTRQLSFQGADLGQIFHQGLYLFYTSNLDALIKKGPQLNVSNEPQTVYRLHLKNRVFESTGVSFSQKTWLGVMEPEHLVFWEPQKPLEIMNLSSKQMVIRRASANSRFFLQHHSPSGALLHEVKSLSATRTLQIKSFQIDRARRLKEVSSFQMPEVTLYELQKIGPSSWALIFQKQDNEPNLMRFGVLRENCIHVFPDKPLSVQKLLLASDQNHLFILASLQEQKDEAYWLRLSLPATLEAANQFTCAPFSEFQTEVAIKLADDPL